MAEHEENQHEVTKKRSTNSLIKNRLVLFVLGLLVGVLVLGGFRFANVKSDETHYHANFGLFIDGQREKFDLPTFYEEVQACGGEVDNPRGRAHMHREEGNDEDTYTLHVHDQAVTWSSFFANLGYGLSNGTLYTGSKSYVDGQDGKRLSFILNGEKLPTIANQVIDDKDVLLVSYGTESAADLQMQYKTIPHTAEEHDNTKDPSTCSGGRELTLTDRLKAAIGLNLK